MLANEQVRTAALAKPYVVDTDIGWVGAGKSQHEALLAAMLFVFERIEFDGPTQAELENSVTQLTAAQQAQGQPNVAALQAAADLLKYKKMIADNLESGAARTALLDLVGCQQVKSLETDNLDNYFKSFRCTTAPSKAVAFVTYWGAVSPNLYDQEDFQPRIASSLFVKYHTNATTTPDLCKMALDCAPYADFFTTGETEAINAAYEDMTSMPLSRAIPDTAILKADIWLELMDRAPPKWYMRDKALKRFPALHYSLIKGALKRAREIIKEEKGVADNANMASVQQNIEALIAMEGAAIEGAVTAGGEP